MVNDLGDCGYCKGLSYVRDELAEHYGHPNFGKLFECPVCKGGRANTPAYERWLIEVSNLTPAELEHTFAGYWANTPERAAALAAARAAVERRTGWLTLHGPHGTGKSYLATAIVNEFRRRQAEARYWMLPALMDHLRQAYSPARPTEDQYSNLFHDLVKVGVLVIDEAQAYSPTPWAAERFVLLVEERYRLADHRLTVWATNADLNAAAPEGLAFLWSRMWEFDVVQVSGADVRPSLGQLGLEYADGEAD